MITKADTALISSQLAELGLNERESAIYLHCLQTGPTTVQAVAKQLNYNRVTAHDAISHLIEEGLLYESRRGKRRLVVAEDPQVFQRLIQTKRNELNLLEDRLAGTISLLERIQVSSESVPNVKFFEEIDGLKKMLEETLTAQGEVLVFTNVELFSDLLDPDYLEDYFIRRARKGIHTRLIFPPSDFANRVAKRSKQYKIQIRLLPPEYQWRSGIFCWNKCVSLKSFTKGRITCTTIENEDIAYFYREVVFDLLWNGLGSSAQI